MKNLFPEKLENNYSLKPKLDLNYKQKNTKYSISINEYYTSKKSDRSNINKEDDDQQLSSASKNLNLMLSNYLESIKIKDNKIDEGKKGFINSILKKKSKNSKNINDTSRENENIKKSISLSNSNILMKASEDNILYYLNKDKSQKDSFNVLNLNNNNMTSISIKSNNIKNKNSRVGSKLNNINANKISSLFSPKRNNKNKKIIKKGKEFTNILYSYRNNNDISSNERIPIRRRPKSFHKKKSKGNTFIININGPELKDKEKDKSTSKKCSKILSSNVGEETIKNTKISKNSKISRKSGNLHKRAKTILLPSKHFENILEQPNKNNSIIKTKKFKNTEGNKDYMKILTLKEIENNIRKTIIGFNLKELKKEIYDFENNECTEIINKLPKFIEDNKEKYISKVSKNTTEFNKTSTTNNNEDELLTYKSKEESVLRANAFQQKYRKLFIIKKIYDSLDDEEMEEEEDNNFYLAPNSVIIYLIDSFVLLSSFIELLYLPFFLAYNIHKCRIHFLSVKSLLFYSADFIYIIDLISGFFRAYYNFEEFLIKDKILICINYLTGWFLLDLIQAIPLYTIYNLKQEKCDIDTIYNHLNYSYIYNFHYSFLILKIIKIFKTLNENRALNRIIYFFNQNDFFYNWSGVFFFLLVILSSLHFCSCFFIFLGKNVYPGWIDNCNLNSSSFKHIYITSLYYVMTTLSTVGYGDITGANKYERYYQMFLLIVGTCVFSWILTFISNYIKKKNDKYIIFENKLKILGEIKMSYPNLNNELYEKILRYLNYNKSEYKYNVENILDSLPSTLQNNLIVEIYKPIIKNFHFFKSFENSDFFVKIVTSLKPILSVKDDILIQEGDVIEDIIFIKKGVLTLEILIDLDSPKESAEQHLNMTGIESMNDLSVKPTEKSKKESKFKNSISKASQNSNMNYTRIAICENKISNKKAIRIIDLRKNEHYGDILMILNEKSPLNLKVRSKKAELFLLPKTDATEISNEYPNIWKRIVNKSLYNMKQIKYLIRKKVIAFCDLNEIFINSELKKKYLEEDEIINAKDKILIDKKINKNKKNNKKKLFIPKRKIETIIYEEDETFENLVNAHNEKKEIKTKKKNCSSKSSNQTSTKLKSSEKLQSNISQNFKKLNAEKILKTNINNNKQNDHIDELKLSPIVFKSNKNKSQNKSEKMSIEKGNRQEKISTKNNFNSVCNINNMISIIDEKMKSSKGQINNFNINIFTPEAVQMPIKQINNNVSIVEPHNSNKNVAKYEDDKNFEKINNEIYYNEDFKINVSGKTISMNNIDKNNNILYPKLKGLLENKKNDKNNISYIKKLLDNNKISDNYLNIQNEFPNNENNSNNNNFNKSNCFFNLNNIKNISFTINSIYENFNQLSKYKFQYNSILRQKTKNFVIYQCFSKQKSFEFSQDSRKKGLVDIYINKNNKAGYQQNESKANSEVHKYNKRDDNNESNKNKKRLFSVDIGNKNNGWSIKRQKTNDIIGNFRRKRGPYLFRNKRKSSSILNYSYISEKGNLFNKKQIKRTLLNNTISEYDSENEKSLYNKVKTFRRGMKFKERERDKDRETSPKSRIINLEDKMIFYKRKKI